VAIAGRGGARIPWRGSTESPARNIRCISVITFIEVLSFPKITPEMEAQIMAFLADVTIIGVTDDVVKIAIEIRRKKLVKFI
jgi:predicted nucleic acid-binding protein